MNKLFALFLFSLLSGPAAAGVPCSVPFTLTNGTIADATQVMANYNALIACLANAAAAGINTDITALNALTTPLIPSSGGSTAYVGGTATGTVNAQVVASVIPSGFALAAGNKVSFLSVGNNSGPTTLNVNGTGVKNVNRIDPGIGSTSLGGGELIGGQMAAVIYDGANYQIQNPAQNKPIGEVFDMGGNCPLGSVEAVGQAVSATTFPGLLSVLSTFWGTSAGNVVLPDLRGRATFGRDGGTGRISAGGGNFDGTIIGNSGGQQFQVLTAAQIPASGYSFSGNSQTPATNQTGIPLDMTGNLGLSTGAAAFVSTKGSAPTLGQATITFTPSGSVTVPGGGNLHPVLSPAAITFKCIRL